jgi:hypothetical protein
VVPVSIAASTRGPVDALRASAHVFVTLAGLSCALTLLFLGMRAVMDIGGACASGGPYVPRVECPEGVPVVMLAGIWGGLIFVGLYLWATSKHDVPTLAGLAWPALFLSLGWNFLEYGIDPPYGEGLVWGWLVCAFFFGLMGGLPLLAMARPIAGQFTRGAAGTRVPQILVPTPARVREVRAARGQTGPAEGDGADSVVGALERLDELHRSGALSDAEFATAKQEVLRGR